MYWKKADRGNGDTFISFMRQLLMASATQINDLEKRNLSNGVYVAVLTPMYSDFSCDHKKLASHCFELIKQGCTGVALFGTTGEGPSFSLAERIEVLQTLIGEGLDPEKIILANGSSGIRDTVRRSWHNLWNCKFVSRVGLFPVLPRQKSELFQSCSY